ncbi:hypothetical protein [Algicola sagamiensis]|uniref:hypothetical protein n=1 Tax=Algicola sagamiensis TaxID=163869 RepID=UPI0003698EDC|nr:hypothetical protein [Algicola sagamiensis]
MPTVTAVSPRKVQAPLNSSGNGSVKSISKTSPQLGVPQGQFLSAHGDPLQVSQVGTVSKKDISVLKELIFQHPKIKRFIEEPKDNCSNAAQVVGECLKELGVPYQYRGFMLMPPAVELTKITNGGDNHIVVIAELGQKKVMIDPTMHQFRHIEEPFCETEEKWFQTFERFWGAFPHKKAIKYQDFHTIDECVRKTGGFESFTSFEANWLHRPAWFSNLWAQGNHLAKQRHSI